MLKDRETKYDPFNVLVVFSGFVLRLGLRWVCEGKSKYVLPVCTKGNVPDFFWAVTLLQSCGRFLSLARDLLPLCSRLKDHTQIDSEVVRIRMLVAEKVFISRTWERAR